MLFDEIFMRQAQFYVYSIKCHRSHLFLTLHLHSNRRPLSSNRRPLSCNSAVGSPRYMADGAIYQMTNNLVTSAAAILSIQSNYQQY